MARLPGIRRIFRHERDGDVDAEMQFHLDARTDDLTRAGLAPVEAHRVALAEFGDRERYQAETARIDRGYARTVRALAQAVKRCQRFRVRCRALLDATPRPW